METRSCVVGEYSAFLLLAVVVLSGLFGPACIRVFVAQFVGLRGVLAPLNKHGTGFDQCVGVPAIALNGYGHQDGVNDLLRPARRERPCPDAWVLVEDLVALTKTYALTIADRLR